MHILIANDDGVYAPGLYALYEALKDYAQCQVVAPIQDMSGASSALTLDRPLYPVYMPNGFIGVNGSPSDCVHLGLNGLLDKVPDIVVSGINLGANLGDDVLYSGTVAAALEGRFTDKPAFAFSLVSRDPTHLETAAFVARKVLEQHSSLEVPAGTVFNINVPNVPLAELKGIKLARLGQRKHAGAAVVSKNPRGKQGFWIAAAGEPADGGPGTDFYAISQGYASITPLQLDRTFDQAFTAMDGWLEGLL